MNKGLCRGLEAASGQPQRSEFIWNERGLVPKIVAGKAYMRPAERSDVSEQIIGRIDAVRAQMFNCALHVKRVPIDDGGDHQIETGRSEVLIGEGAVGNPTLLMGVNRPR